MVTTLSNAFELGRIPQAIMLSGIRGVGKTTTARILARALNYQPNSNQPPPHSYSITDEIGAHCQAIIEGRHVDVIELDAASNTGVDSVRDLIEKAIYAPALAKFRVYIIDEVHMLSKGAFNALLKTLEEPPAHVKFILATTEINRVPATVLSRCMRFDLARLQIDRLAAYLEEIAIKEGAKIDDSAIRIIAKSADGSVRDSLSILESALVLAKDSNVTADDLINLLGIARPNTIAELFDFVINGQLAKALGLLESQVNQGTEPLSVISSLSELVHKITRLKILAGNSTINANNDPLHSKLLSFAERLSIPYLTRCWQILHKGINEIKTNPSPQAAAEMVLVKISYVSDLPTINKLSEAVQSAMAAMGSTTIQSKPENAGSLIQPTSSSQHLSNSDTNPPKPIVKELKLGDLTPTSASDNDTHPKFQTFTEIIQKLREKNEMILSKNLEQFVRPINLQDNYLKISASPGAPKDMVQNLRSALKKYLDEKWVVENVVEALINHSSISDNSSHSDEKSSQMLSDNTTKPANDMPLTENERQTQQLNEKIAQVISDPLVQAVQASFPKAKITDVSQSI